MTPPATAASSRASRTQTMQAAVVTAPRKIEVREAPVPNPGPQQIRVKIQGCGVCASNIPPWEGREWFSYPMQPGQLGHEAWGTVHEVGRAVSGLSEGQ